MNNGGDMIWWTLGLILLGLVLWVVLRPIPLSGLDSHADPVTSYEQAMIHAKAMQEEDNTDLARDVCITKLFDHGTQTEHVIVLLHGFTNCPEQFNELGKQFFNAGFNVFIPRLPYHGLSDRLTDALARLKAEDLAVFGDKIMNIARGMGKRVTVMGISGGGNLAAWLAQNRMDLDFAFPIAAFFGLISIPSWLTKFFVRLGLVAPNFFMWWDPRTKADNPHSIYYAYPRYPIRAMVEIFRLATAIQTQAEKTSPAAKAIVMVINDAEPSVSNADLIKLLETWKKHGKGNLGEYHFEKDLKLPHDFITPRASSLLVENSYSRLIKVVKDIHADHQI